jgi:D-sedoheptulose 7-phosphate isomerase
MNMKQHIDLYRLNLTQALALNVEDSIASLGAALLMAWRSKKTIYLCGNGGSAGNAIHLANDFLYGAGKKNGIGLRVEALSANPAVLTCLANDLGYDNVYSEQIRVKGNADDVLIVLSGSGNSQNIVKVLEVANQIGMKTFAILGFTGGLCKELAQTSIHFEVGDMQIAEDLQLIVGHMCMQWLHQQTL